MAGNGYRLGLSGIPDRLLVGAPSKELKPLKAGLGCNAPSLFAGADQFSDPVQPSGAFSIPGRTPSVIKGLDGLRGRKHRLLYHPRYAVPPLVKRAGVVAGTW